MKELCFEVRVVRRRVLGKGGGKKVVKISFCIARVGCIL